MARCVSPFGVTNEGGRNVGQARSDDQFPRYSAPALLLLVAAMIVLLVLAP